MNRQVASAAGAMLLIGVGTLTSPAFSQGPMAPRMDVAPPPVRVAPPPPPPVFVPPVVPTPPPMPVAPVMAPPPPPAPKAPTASAPATPTPVTPAPVATPTPAPPPATASPQTPRATASAPPPYTDSQVKALRGVGVGLRGPGGTRQLTSDSNGVVSLGKLGPGRHELTVNPKSLGPGTQPGAQPVALIGLLLPAVQKVRDGEPRYRTVVLKPVNDQTPVSIRLQYDDGSELSSVDLGNGNAIFASYSVGDLNARLSVADVKLFDDLAKRNTSGETRLVFVTPVPGSTAAALADANGATGSITTTGLGTSPGNPAGPGKPTANEAIINTTRSNIKKPNAMLPNVGVTATGPGGAVQARSDGEGWTRLGKLPVGNTVIEFSGPDLASALTKMEEVKFSGSGLVIGVVTAVRTDGTVAVFTGSVPASAVKSLKADLRIGRDGNAMEANWGNGQQLPQILPKTGTATLIVPGPNGPIPLDPAFVKSLQDRVAGSAPGMVDANAAMGDVSTARLSTSPGNPADPGTPTAQEASIASSGTVIAQEAIINTSRDNIKKPPPKLPNVGVTSTGPDGTRQMRSDGEGWTRFGKLSIGNTVFEFNGADLASALTVTGTSATTLSGQNQIEGSTGIIIGVVAAAALKTPGAPTEPTRQQTNIELLVVISLVAIKTDGTPVVFTGSVPAKDVKTLKADLRIGRDGNAMAVDWGNGPQAPQEFRVEVGNSNTAYDSIATMVRQAKPGEVFAFHALQEVDTPR